MTESEEMQALVVRVEMLEKRSRRLTVGLWLVGGILIAVLAAASFMPDEETIEARAFLLKDEHNHVRASLALNQSRDACLTLHDRAEQPRALIGVGESGTAGMFLTVGQSGSAGMLLADEHGKPLAGILAEANTPMIALFNKQGAVEWSAPPPAAVTASERRQGDALLEDLLPLLLKLAVRLP